MKLLFDQNLSHRLVKLLSDLYPGSLHVRQLGFDTTDDEAIWNFAKANGLTIVSKDTDFQQRSFLFGPPPKVIWVAVSDCSTDDVIAVIRSRHQEIVDFHNDQTASYLALV
jgi:predicted nuclease of predicted toxin-antitoxin system